MKRIEAIIRHEKLESVKDALISSGIHGMTVVQAHGCGRERGAAESYRGTEYSVDFIPRLLLVLYVSDPLVSVAVDILLRSASTSQIGDGKIVIQSLEEAIRIRTGETGEEAF